MFGWLKSNGGGKKDAVKKAAAEQEAAHQKLMEALERRRKHLFGEALLVKQKSEAGNDHRP